MKIHAGKFMIERHTSGALIAYEGSHTGISLTGNAVAQAMFERMEALIHALEDVLPYAISRGEDLQAAKDVEDPDYPGADVACNVIEAASNLLEITR